MPRCHLGSVSHLGHLPFGGTASVISCGPIGLLLIAVLKAAGASSVLAVEPLAHRRAAASRYGADLSGRPRAPWTCAS